jgi:DNA polymerase-1
MAPRLYMIDGSALVYRAYYALQRAPLTTSRGEPTTAVFGFAQSLLTLLRQEKPEYLAVVFDARGPTFRNEIDPDYKGNRTPMPDDLAVQQPWIRELVDAWPCARLEVSGVEADDVIGSYARQLAGENLDVVMVTSDKDFYQLLGEHVKILNPGRGGPSAIPQSLIGPEGVTKKFGVEHPRQVIDVLALTGDTSDNVPGVPGIGPKTASKLIREYGSLDGLLGALDAIPSPRIRERLAAHRDAALTARELVSIRSDLELPLDLEALRARPPGGEALTAFLQRMEFRNILVELGGDRARVAAEPDEERFGGYSLVEDLKGLKALAQRLREAEGGFAFDTETTSLSAVTTELVGIAFAVAPGEAYYVNVSHAGGHPLGTPLTARVLGPVLADPGVPKTAHHAKFDELVLESAGMPVAGLVFDTMIASYVLNPERSHKLDSLAQSLLGRTMIPITDLIGKGAKQITMREVDPATAMRYAAEDADMTLGLRDHFAPELDREGMRSLFADVELPLIHVLASMERRGVRIDEAHLAGMGVHLQKELERLERRCHDLADMEFNVNSPAQLADVLFVRLALPTGKKIKTGFSTDSEVLEKLRVHHDLPGAVLEYRQVSKLKSTYVDTLPAMVNPATGRVHTSYHQTVAATGRLASSDPNLQNIPVRTPLGREVRRAFIPGEPGWKLVSADYSQIELRIMAHLSRDPVFVDAFHRNADVHRDTAARLFGVPPEAVTDTQRAQAKTVNFGILYGQGPYGLARTLGIGNQEASEFIREYKGQFSGVVRYLEGVLEKARADGFVTTLLGRRRFLPNLRARGGPARAAAERLAINTPIQGSAADMIKMAMIRVHGRLAVELPDAHLLLQVHDELLLECPWSDAERVGEAVREEMERAVVLDVPVVVNVGIGDDWAEIH